MPSIATIGAKVKITPDDEIQIIHGPSSHEFIDDRTPFSISVSGTVMDTDDELVGVFGKVISGHPRYQGQIATLLIRVDNADWGQDNRSGANFKVGRSMARPNGRFPFYHPEGTDIDGYPYVISYGSVDSRAPGEATVNSALEIPGRTKAEPIARPNDKECDGV